MLHTKHKPLDIFLEGVLCLSLHWILFEGDNRNSPHKVKGTVRNINIYKACHGSPDKLLLPVLVLVSKSVQTAAGPFPADGLPTVPAVPAPHFLEGWLESEELGG